MAPDLNSLPPSRSPTNSPLHSRVRNGTAELGRHQTPSPRSSSISLAAAASVNAGLQNQESRRSSISSNQNRSSPQIERLERRISNTVASLSLNDPTLPGPGELQGDHRSRRASNAMGRSSRGNSRDDLRGSRATGDPGSVFPGHSWQTVSPSTIGGSPTIATGDPHHSRQQSLGELHQVLEQEQEGLVVRSCPEVWFLYLNTRVNAFHLRTAFFSKLANKRLSFLLCSDYWAIHHQPAALLSTIFLRPHPSTPWHITLLRFRSPAAVHTRHYLAALTNSFLDIRRADLKELIV